MDSDSREELFDSSLNTVNVSVNTELQMDSSSSPKEEEKNFLHFYGEMEDDDFHKMMSVDDLTYSIAFSDEVFDNGEWHTYAGLETCNVIKHTRHGKETRGKGVQSNPAKEVSSNSNLTYLSGDDTKLGTDHTKADVYESSNNVSVSNSISENQMQSDSYLEDDLFFLAENNEICSDSDDGSYFLAEESLIEVLDASSKSSSCTVVSSQENNGLTDLDPGTAQRSSEVPDPWDRWEDVDLASCCVFDEMLLETCDDEKSFRPIDFVSSSTDDIDYATEFLRDYSNLKQLLSADLLDDCNDENSIWSILTDKLLYCQSDISDSVRYFSYDSLKAKSAKQRFFDAALNNEPCSNNSYFDSCNIEYCNVKDLYRDQLYDAVPIPLKNSKKKTLNTAEATASRNVPTKKLFPQYVENKYEDLEVHTSHEFDPAKSICATYLWTENVGIQKNWLQPQHIILKVINCGLNREDSQLE